MKLKELRGSKTQVIVSEDLDIPVKNLSNYEIGRTEPDIKTLIKIADYFDVSLDYLCERQWNNQVGYIPENKKELINKILELKDENIKQADAYITALIDSNK